MSTFITALILVRMASSTSCIATQDDGPIPVDERTVAAGNPITIGKWQFPLSSGRVELLRQGQAFWEVLEAHGVPSTIIRMPANFPPSGKATRELSGMGTPDILGTYGVFSLFTSDTSAFAGLTLSGGTVHYVDASRGVVHGTLEGPDQPYLEPEKS